MISPLCRSTRWWQNLVSGLFLGFASVFFLLGSRCNTLANKHRCNVNMSLTRDIDVLKTMDNMEAQEYLQKEIKRRISAYKFLRSSSPQIFLLFSLDDVVIEKIEKELAHDF